jgi:acyl-[acyl-carrier-protein]-phospholipid O-acyltransferase/long-chain-fatty-acid--[acyl-carrier-protein] ligase
MNSKRKLLSSFASLNIVQFLSALNDNIFKLLFVFLLIHKWGPQKSYAILALAGAIFVMPFLLFASLAGTIADRYSKKRVITITRFVEIGIMSAAVGMIALQSAVGGYIILFCMATTSAIFSPCKFGIIPEIVKKEKISHYNGLMTATTYLAIILGTFLASLLTDVTKRNFVLSSMICVAIALFGALFSLGIETTPAQASEKKVSARLFSDIYRTLRKAQRIRYLLVAIIFAAYFLFIGAYVQLNIIPFAIQSLGQSEIQGGYLFLMTAIGIGIGSFLSGKLSGKEIELGYVPLAALGLTSVLICLYLFASHFYVIIPLLILLGILGGFYIVPMESYIQAASLPQDRGQNVAAANFMSFLGVIFASVLLGIFGVFLHLSAATGFFVVGLVTFLVALLLFLTMADQVLRLLIARCAQYFWNLKVTGRKNLNRFPTLLLVAKRNSWLDTVVVMATLPRLIRYMVPLKGRFIRSRTLIYHLLALLPLDREHIVPLGSSAIKLIRRELMLGHPVCLMEPTDLKSSNLKEWEEQVNDLVEGLGVPTLPIYIQRPPVPEGASYWKQFLSLFKHPIKVSFGEIQWREKR